MDLPGKAHENAHTEHPQKQTIKCSDWNSELRMARGNCGAKTPCRHAPILKSDNQAANINHGFFLI